MSIAINRPRTPSVFDAGLPSIDYQHVQDPEDAHAMFREARRQAPIAIGPHGPELLTYDLVRCGIGSSRTC